MLRKGIAGKLRKIRIFVGYRAENDLLDAQIQIGFDGLEVSDASTQLNGNGNGLDDFFNGILVHRSAAHGSVKIHPVDSFGTCV